MGIRRKDAISSRGADRSNKPKCLRSASRRIRQRTRGEVDGDDRLRRPIAFDRPERKRHAPMPRLQHRQAAIARYGYFLTDAARSPDQKHPAMASARHPAEHVCARDGRNATFPCLGLRANNSPRRVQWLSAAERSKAIVILPIGPQRYALFGAHVHLTTARLYRGSLTAQLNMWLQRLPRHLTTASVVERTGPQTDRVNHQAIT